MAIRKLLVANRGEIAVRIFRTCRKLGIATVAVVAPDDAGSLHARSADEAVEIAGYLQAEEHVRAARQSGADAVHPGYGFLAESPDFAEAVEAAGLVFVGPSPDEPAAGRRQAGGQGDRTRRRRPGRPGGRPGRDRLPARDQGRGRRRRPRDAGRPRRRASSTRRWTPRSARRRPPSATTACSASATSSGRATSRSSSSPTRTGTSSRSASASARSSAATRRCSRSRPRPRSIPSLRARMSEAAVAFARAIGYRSAGTAEFMVDGSDFWFLELNGRIQVEHPVTELVTGVDLVAEQLRIAAGGQVTDCYLAEGHAVEVRLYAEDPRLVPPAGGHRIERLRLPDRVRVDAGVAEGDEVGIAYDPMIAKLIAHADTRDEALDRLAAALDDTVVEGVTTNLPFLRWLVRHPDVRRGETTTAFLVEHPPLSAPPARPVPRVWRGSFRLNLPFPSARAAAGRRRDAEHARRGRRREQRGRADARHRHPRARRRGRRSRGAAAAVVLEAMKMETPLVSPYDAVVRRVHVSEGDRVAGGAVLVELEE